MQVNIVFNGIVMDLGFIIILTIWGWLYDLFFFWSRKIDIIKLQDNQV